MEIFRYLVQIDHDRLAKYLRSQLIFEEKPFIKNEGIIIFASYIAPGFGPAHSFQGHSFGFVYFDEDRPKKSSEDQKLKVYVPSEQIIGRLDVIDISEDHSVMHFVLLKDFFHQALSKILELVSEIKPIIELGKESPSESKIPILGNALKIEAVSSDYQGSVNEADKKGELVQSQEPQTNIQVVGSLPWDVYAIDHWNKGETAKQIVKGIKENRLGNIQVGRFYNRKSELSKAHPELKIRRGRGKL